MISNQQRWQIKIQYHYDGYFSILKLLVDEIHLRIDYYVPRLNYDK